jgi:hypothetical protein
MKKIILIGAILMIPTASFAIDCAKANGTLIYGNDGTTYCKSNRTMNWWTALGWCKSIGMQPFEFPKNCSCTTEKCPTKEAGCSSLSGISTDEVWSSTPSVNTGAYSINLATGNVNHQIHMGFGSRANTLKMICR